MQSAAKENSLHYINVLSVSVTEAHACEDGAQCARGYWTLFIFIFAAYRTYVLFNTHTYVCQKAVFANILVNTVILKQTAEKENTCILDLGSS